MGKRRVPLTIQNGTLFLQAYNDGLQDGTLITTQDALDLIETYGGTGSVRKDKRLHFVISEGGLAANMSVPLPQA